MKTYSLITILFLIPFLSSAADYYWVGGTGNWSDISHWKTTSGGVVGHAQAPGPEDNAIFDGNSFSAPGQVVTFNTDINFCRNLDLSAVTNNPQFIAGEFITLSIYGEVLLSTSLDFQFGGEIFLTGDLMNKRINFGGHKAARVIQFNGTGSWIFESAIDVDSMFEVVMGTLDFNDQMVTTDHFYIIGSGQKNIDLKNSIIQVNGAFLDMMYISDEVDIKSMVIQTDHLNLTPGGSTISITSKNPALWYQGNNALSLNNVEFTALDGKAILTDWQTDGNINIETLDIASSAVIDGRLNVGILNLRGGSVYAFESNQTFSFSEISANGNCAESVVVTATNTGEQATFEVNAGNIVIDFLTLRDISAIGGANFMANNGVDLGNNTGWDFSSSSAQNFYWIGGTGNWTDPLHWSFTSGGPTSGCVPTGKDDVFFDINSFSAAGQSVIVNRENIFVHDMTWDGVGFMPELVGEETFKIVVTGSLELDANMVNAFEGDFSFESGETGNTIRSNGIVFLKHIEFSGTNGSWMFLDAHEVRQTVYFRSGNLNTNGQDLTCLRFLSESETNRNLDITGSYITLQDYDYDYPYWSVMLDNFNIIADHSTIEFVGSYYGSFWHYGSYPNGEIPIFNKVIFSCFTGVYGMNNWSIPSDQPMAEVDSLIYNTRGEIYGSNKVEFLQLRSGYEYRIDSDNETSVQYVENMEASGSCSEGHTRIYGSTPGNLAKFEFSKNHTFQRLAIQDVSVQGSGSLTAENSVDEGRNVNITFIELGPRTLYWVGGGGNWQDEAHWSLSSGGLGGECIPTLIDDVIFDVNSFTTDFQNVESEGGRFRYCHDINWSGTTNMPTFSNNFLVVGGSILYDESFHNYVWQHIFVNSEPEVVTANGQSFSHLMIRGSSNVTFLDDLYAEEINHDTGDFTFENIKANLNGIYFYTNKVKNVNLRDSYVTVRGSSGDVNYPTFRDYTGGSLNINPGNSTIDFTALNSGLFIESDTEFGGLIFSNPQGNGTLVSHWSTDDNPNNRGVIARNIDFSGNGTVIGYIETDTLIGAPGKTYILESDTDNKVDGFLQMIGNNCTPIELRSSLQGSKSSIIMPSSARILANFVQMQDQIGTGGADFNAGSRSTDIGNSNTGWYFDDTPDVNEAGFLGEDRALCTGQDLVLDAYSYSPNEVYLWNDGSSDSSLVVNSSGVYFVEVQFESSCILRDTVEIFTAQDVVATLPANVDGCEGEIIELDAEVPLNTAQYTWNNGAVTPLIEVNESGTYVVEIDVDGCITTAFSEVTIVKNPGLDLGMDRAYCEGEIFSIESSVSADNYLWQDGSTTQEISGILAGLYWLEIDHENCTFRDSIVINLVSPPFVDLGNDTIICDNEEFFLQFDNANGYALNWQDGSFDEQIQVTEAGKYLLTVDDNGCISKDSVEISFIAAPIVDLGFDLEACDGELITLNAPATSGDIIWEDGSTDMVRQVTEGGVYEITVQENGCLATDSIRLNFKPIPRVNLGKDTTVCDDMPYVLTAVSERGMILWEDGSSDPSFTVLSPGQISVSVIEDGCIGSDSILVNFKECISFQAYIPTAFSPNEDGFNDQFKVYFPEGLVIEKYEMRIYDRWGNQVFESSDLSFFWDGRVQSEILDKGVYTYFVEVEYVDDFGPNEALISGDVTIMR